MVVSCYNLVTVALLPRPANMSASYVLANQNRETSKSDQSRANVNTEWKQREKVAPSGFRVPSSDFKEILRFSASIEFKMARDKKDNSKAKEKKAKRLEMEKKMNERVAMVKKANEVTDPLAELPSFKRYFCWLCSSHYFTSCDIKCQEDV